MAHARETVCFNKVNLRSQEFLIDNRSRNNQFDSAETIFDATGDSNLDHGNIEKNLHTDGTLEDAALQSQLLLDNAQSSGISSPSTTLQATSHILRGSASFGVESNSSYHTAKLSANQSDTIEESVVDFFTRSSSSVNETCLSSSPNGIDTICSPDQIVPVETSVGALDVPLMSTLVKAVVSESNFFGSSDSISLDSSSLPATPQRHLNLSSTSLINDKIDCNKDDAFKTTLTINTASIVSPDSSLNSIKMNDSINKQLSRYQHSHRSSDASTASVSTTKLETLSDPTEWPIERVLMWLETNNFPQDWISIFQENNIHGNKFLALVSYQNLKALALPVPSTMSGEPSRFIHMLRKILNRSSSSSSSATSQLYSKSLHISSYNMASAPNSVRETNVDDAFLVPNSKHIYETSHVISESDSIEKDGTSCINDESLEEIPVNLAHSKDNISPTSENHLRSDSGSSSVEFMISGSSKHNGNHLTDVSKHVALHSESSLPVLRENKSLDPRPLTTYSANPVRVSGSYGGQSPSSPSFTHGFFKRHHKSSSMDFSGLFSNSCTNLAQNMSYTGHSGDDRPSKVPVKDINEVENKKGRGVLNRLWRRDKDKYDRVMMKDVSGSRRNFHVNSPVSPITPSFNSSNSNNVGFSVFKESTSTTYSLKDGMIPIKDSLLNQQRFQPVQKGFVERFIFVTTDNINFIFIEITNIKTSKGLKELIFQKIGIPMLDTCEFCLTDVGCDPGEVLSDDAFKELYVMHSSRINNLKIFVKLPAPFPVNKQPSQIKVPSVASVSPTVSYEGDLSSGNAYPATPLYLYTESPGLDSSDVDYFSALPHPSYVSLADEQQVKKGPLKKALNNDPVRRKTVRKNFKNDIYTNPISEALKNLSDSSVDSGRVSSPARSRSTNLVALRNAPPPPVGSQNSFTEGMSVVSSNIIEPPVNSFTPGSTEDLIPQPYINLKRLVSRKPVSPASSKKAVKDGVDENTVYSEKLATNLDRKNSVVSSLERKKSKFAVKKDAIEFVENDVTFEGAPVLEDSDGDSGSSDDGLWAKKPPINNSKKSCLVTRPSLRTSLRPELRVQIGNTSLIDCNENISSTLSPSLDSDQNQCADEFSTVRQLPSPNLGSGGEVWAVRPPAELLYDNLEKFFPNTDLDKPIIDDNMLSPPLSPNADSASSSVYPHLTVSPYSNGTPSKELSSASLTSSTLAVSPTSYKGISSSSTLSNNRSEIINSDNFNSGQDLQNSPSFSNQPISMTSSQVTPIRTRAGRMKSIRVVAREASKRFKTNARTEDRTKLLRRKSTKMWGQKVIEATQNEINCGQLSTLRDHRGQHKQFVWVKGELIGKGTFGKVYLALNVTTGEMMAVKQVRIPKAASDRTSERQQEALEALHAEVATMKDLDHLNIVQYLGFETVPNAYNLFLEYVPGGSVGTCLRLHGRFEHDVIKSLTKQVLLGLSYLHECGILHRDLKADNLLLDLDGVCKISDFGISKRSSNIYANDAGMSMQGTIFWMAPEVIHNVVHNEKQGYSAKVDIWSLGCVVLEMFAGRRPWSNDEAIGAMYKLGKTRLAPPIPEDTLPYVLKKDKDFLDLCFTIDPESRPTAKELLMNSFCELDDNFNFLDTKLARLIKFNDKRADGFPQLDSPNLGFSYT